MSPAARSSTNKHLKGANSAHLASLCVARAGPRMARVLLGGSALGSAAVARPGASQFTPRVSERCFRGPLRECNLPRAVPLAVALVATRTPRTFGVVHVGCVVIGSLAPRARGAGEWRDAECGRSVGEQAAHLQVRSGSVPR